MLKFLCTYCSQELRPRIDNGSSGELISHGVCRDCMELALAGSGQPFDEFLNSFSEPIFVVDNTGAVRTANLSAQKTINKNIGQITNKSGGDVFGCLYADEAGGCGETLHCLSCTIRNTVMTTFASGQSFEKIAACHDLDTVSGERRVRFTITTEKIGDAVFLRIDNMEQLL